jgi:sugar O-acyltransferase (sialic acid O-acetyltransferase NeuD family)
VRADSIQHLMPVNRELPEDCERVIVVGAGGFGREVLQWARDAWPADAAKIAGFLSNDVTKLDGYHTGLPILGSPEDFEPKSGDYFVLAIGIPDVRRQVAERMLARGYRFLTLVHPTAILFATAVVGDGAVICPFVVLSDSVRVGRFVLLNYHSSVAHDASIGDFAVLSPYATAGGGATVGDAAFLGLHATIAPGVTAHGATTISANSVLHRDAPPGVIVFGVPGRMITRIRC